MLLISIRRLLMKISTSTAFATAVPIVSTMTNHAVTEQLKDLIIAPSSCKKAEQERRKMHLMLLWRKNFNIKESNEESKKFLTSILGYTQKDFHCFPIADPPQIVSQTYEYFYVAKEKTPQEKKAVCAYSLLLFT